MSEDPPSISVVLYIRQGEQLDKNPTENNASCFEVRFENSCVFHHVRREHKNQRIDWACPIYGCWESLAKWRHFAPGLEVGRSGRGKLFCTLSNWNTRIQSEIHCTEEQSESRFSQLVEWCVETGQSQIQKPAQ